jgi:hypothetical protein
VEELGLKPQLTVSTTHTHLHTVAQEFWNSSLGSLSEPTLPSSHAVYLLQARAFTLAKPVQYSKYLYSQCICSFFSLPGKLQSSFKAQVFLTMQIPSL